MSERVLHLPLDFERRDYVRRLARWDARAPLFVMRLWIDWATAGVSFRPLKFQPAERPFPTENYPWSGDDLTYIIEEFCGYDGEGHSAGALITAALSAGVLSVEEQDGVFGLTLRDFWRLNAHLSPAHKTIQQRGGLAKAARRNLAEIDDLADRQLQIMASRGQLLFPPKVAPSPEEARRSLALVMKLDRACDRSTRRSAEYTEDETLMLSALDVVRRYDEADLNRVYEYIVRHRDDPRLVKLPDRLLEHFDDLQGKANADGN